MASEFILNKSEESWLSTIASVYDMREEAEGDLKLVVTNASKRSLNQNSLYWKWLGEISSQLRVRIKQSHDTDTLHEYMKLQYCPCKEVQLGSNSKPISIRSTKRLDKGEMHRYLSLIEQWSVERGFRLTMPGDCEYVQLREVQNA